MVLQQKLYTVEEFEVYVARPENRDRHFELINGEIVEKSMPTQLHGLIAAFIIIRIGMYLQLNPIARIGTEVRHRVPGDKHNARQPDVSIYLDTETPPVTVGDVAHLPDIAIEVKSPNDTYQGQRDKAAYYIANGTHMVWLIFPEKRLVEVYEPNKDLAILNEHDTLEGGELLPGFKLPVADIFEV